MGDTPLFRLLELVKRRLGARDARVEIGGEPPTDPTVLWASGGPGRRLVALFEELPPDVDEKRKQIEALAEVFRDVVAAPEAPPASVPPARLLDAALDGALTELANDTGAECALLIDGASPVVWGRSHEEIANDVETMLRANTLLEEAGWRGEMDNKSARAALLQRLHAEDEPAAVLLERLTSGREDPEAFDRWAFGCWAVALTRARMASARRTNRRRAPQHATTRVKHILRDGRRVVLVRGLGGVYLIVLAFRSGFSQPRVEGMVRRTRPKLEQLLAALPPRDPTPFERGGKVLALRRPRV
jgi:hypothetical protein